MRTSVKFKLIAAFIGVALIAMIVGVFGIINMKTIEKADTELYEKITAPMGNLYNIGVPIQRARVNLHKMFLTDDVDVIDDYEKKIDDYFALSETNMTEFEKTILTKEGQDVYDSFKKSIKDYRSAEDKMINFLKTGNKLEAQSILNGEGLEAGNAMNDSLTKLSELKINLAKQSSDNNKKISNNSTLIMMIAIAIGFAISIFLGLWMGIIVISRPLNRISDTLGSGAGQIALASNQLSSSSQEIANGATEQASSIEETTSSMEELASMVKQNVQNAKEASVLADKASTASQTGYAQMEKMLESMNDINKSSDQIQKIIKVIDDIAFQTNILALNAAVEAARAGEAGMGFAVVADEVKNLANRSADAAKETSSMIEDSIKKTQGGLDIATKLAEVFKEILTNAQKVSEMSKEVETASRQQDTGINQVNKAIVQFDEVVQSNASSAEETASSAEELLAQVETLNSIVSQLVLLVTGKEKLIEQHKKEQIEYTAKKTNQIKTYEKKQISQPKESRKKEIDPEKIIPFEEDEEFKQL